MRPAIWSSTVSSTLLIFTGHVMHKVPKQPETNHFMGKLTQFRSHNNNIRGPEKKINDAAGSHHKRINMGNKETPM